MHRLETNYLGLRLKTPIIASSAGTTETLERMKRAEEAGAGAVIMKSFFEREEYREDHTPHFVILRRKTGRYRADTLYSAEQASTFNEEEYAEEIRKAKEVMSIPVIANIDCYNFEKSIQVAKLFSEAGADALEIKACPHGELSMSGNSYEEVMIKILDEIRANIHIPLSVKLVGQLNNPVSTSLNLEKAGADGVVMFNRLAGLDIDTDLESPIMHGGYAGHGGLWTIYYALRWISALYPKTGLSICGTSGAFSGEDVVKYLLAGASSVAICTAILLRGYEAITEMNVELLNWMDSKGYFSVSEFLGAAAYKVKGIEDIVRGKEVAAVIDQSKCTACGLCAKSCFRGLIHLANDQYCVDTDKCVGCGLCEQVCPTKAISMGRTADNDARVMSGGGL